LPEIRVLIGSKIKLSESLKIVIDHYEKHAVLMSQFVLYGVQISLSGRQLL
jgi:hypothetical protein